MRAPSHSPISEAVDPFAAAGLSGHPACRMAAATEGGARAAEILTPAELSRLERMKSPSRRAEMKGSFAMRRDLIAEMTGCSLDDVRLDTHADGAPFLLRPAGWSVSLANKENYTVVALAPAPSAIGVDVEVVREFSWKPPLSMTSSDAERAELEAASDEIETDIRKFFRMWTLKEAVLKSTGLGFRAGPKAVETPMAILRAPGSGTLEAFGDEFEFWTADAGETIVSLVRKRT